MRLSGNRFDTAPESRSIRAAILATCRPRSSGGYANASHAPPKRATGRPSPPAGPRCGRTSPGRTTGVVRHFPPDLADNRSLADPSNPREPARGVDGLVVPIAHVEPAASGPDRLLGGDPQPGIRGSGDQDVELSALVAYANRSWPRGRPPGRLAMLVPTMPPRRREPGDVHGKLTFHGHAGRWPPGLAKPSS